MIIIFSACVPSAVAPPALNTTPGSAAVVTRDSYRNDRFSLEHPAGWRVITSPSGAPPGVTLVAPGDCALIVVSSAPLDAPPTAPSCDQPDIRTVERSVTLASGQIVIAGSAPDAQWDAFLQAVDQIAASLKAVS